MICISQFCCFILSPIHYPPCPDLHIDHFWRRKEILMFQKLAMWNCVTPLFFCRSVKVVEFSQDWREGGRERGRGRERQRDRRRREKKKQKPVIHTYCKAITLNGMMSNFDFCLWSLLSIWTTVMLLPFPNFLLPHYCPWSSDLGGWEFVPGFLFIPLLEVCLSVTLRDLSTN